MAFESSYGKEVNDSDCPPSLPAPFVDFDSHNPPSTVNCVQKCSSRSASHSNHRLQPSPHSRPFFTLPFPPPHPPTSVPPNPPPPLDHHPSTTPPTRGKGRQVVAAWSMGCHVYTSSPAEFTARGLHKSQQGDGYSSPSVGENQSSGMARNDNGVSN